MEIEIINTGANKWDRVLRIHYDDRTTQDIDLDANVRSLLSGGARNDPAAIAAAATDFVQMAVDRHIEGGVLNLADLPDDMPEKTIDPGKWWYCHARIHPASQLGQGANAVQVHRPILKAGIGGTATLLLARPTRVWVELRSAGGFAGAIRFRFETPPRAFY